MISILWIAFICSIEIVTNQSVFYKLNPWSWWFQQMSLTSWVTQTWFLRSTGQNHCTDLHEIISSVQSNIFQIVSPRLLSKSFDPVNTAGDPAPMITRITTPDLVTGQPMCPAPDQSHPGVPPPPPAPAASTTLWDTGGSRPGADTRSGNR